MNYIIQKKFYQLSIIILMLLCYSLSAQTGEFRFAWLTDIHIGARTANQDLRLTVDDINQQPDIDFVIISGDITELDVDGYLDTAKVILDQLDIPYHLIPGNHDTKWSSSGCTKFEKLWQDEEFSFRYNGVQFIGFDQGPVMRMGFGYVIPEDIRWLKKELAKLEQQDLPIVIVSHYPLDESVGNYREVLKILKNYNIQAILHGHGHTNRAQNYSGIPGIMGRSTLRAGDESGGYNLVSVSPNSLKFQTRITGKETRDIWHRLPVKEHNIKIPHSKKEAAINDNYPAVETKWQFESGYSITNAASVADNKVFFGNGSGKLYALNLHNGKEIWTFPTENRVYSRPAIHDSRVVFGSTDSTIYCLNIKNGDLFWKIKTKAPVVASPIIHKNIVYIGGSDDHFRAIDLESGKIIWQYNKIPGYVEIKPLIHDDKAIFGAWDNNLYALNLADGSLAWKWNDGRQGILYSPAACRPVANNGRVYIVAPDRVLSCIDIETGATIWRSKRDMVRESIGISENNKTVFARCMRDTVFAIDATTAQFDYNWKKSCGYGYDIDPSMPIEKNGTVFFGTGYGNVYALDKTSGRLKWKYNISNTLINNTTPLSGNEVIVTSLDGKVSYIQNNR